MLVVVFDPDAVLDVLDTVLSPIDSIRKDLALIADAARSTGLPTDVLDAMRAVHDRASADGYSGEDMARVAGVLAGPGAVETFRATAVER